VAGDDARGIPILDQMAETMSDDAAGVLQDYRRWLHAAAYRFRAPGSPDHDDLVQEGYIAMWRALSTYNPSCGALPSWLTRAAEMRMTDLVYGHGQWTGRPQTRGSRSVEADSLDAEIGGLDGDAPPALGVDDSLDERVVWAYHEGEIAAALDTLSPAQRRYVLARFWCGLNPRDRAPGHRALIRLVPELRRGYLWHGTSHQKGARQRLAEALAHLARTA